MANWLFWPVITVPLNMAKKHSKCGFVFHHLNVWTQGELTFLNHEGNLGGFLCKEARRIITAHCILTEKYFKKQDFTVNIYTFFILLHSYLSIFGCRYLDCPERLK